MERSQISSVSWSDRDARRPRALRSVASARRCRLRTSQPRVYRRGSIMCERREGIRAPTPTVSTVKLRNAAGDELTALPASAQNPPLSTEERARSLCRLAAAGADCPKKADVFYQDQQFEARSCALPKRTTQRVVRVRLGSAALETRSEWTKLVT